jgi:hypothetical protein
VRISADRALYLSRVLSQYLAANPKLALKVDPETLRRALTREISESAAELEAMEKKVRANLEARNGATSRDFDLLFARDLEDEIRKHGA